MKDKAALYKALADETRLRILALLLTAGELCVCDVSAALKIPQPTISRHLACLRRTGWVNDRRSGLWIYYSINEDGASRGELIPLLRNQLVQSDRACADMAELASFGRGNRCGRE